MRSRPCSLSIILASPTLLCACWLQTPPKPTPQQLSAGLILIYPGISSAPTDMINWYTALRDAGIKQAILVKPYGPTMDLIGNLTNWESHKLWSIVEAQRIARYVDAYPGRPVTLIGYSGGGAIAPLVAEAMPEGYVLDRLLLFSSGLSAGYDLAPALDRTDKGIVHFWSSVDVVGPAFTLVLGTMDRYFELPAAALGFDMVDDRLIQFIWTPDMIEFNNKGDHTDYLWNEAWVREFVTPWITRDDARRTSDVPPELEGRITITSP